MLVVVMRFGNLQPPVDFGHPLDRIRIGRKLPKVPQEPRDIRHFPVLLQEVVVIGTRRCPCSM